MQARLVSVWSRPCASANDYHGYPAIRVIEKKLGLPSLRWVDSLSEALGRVGDIMVVLIAVFLTDEVIARDVFLAPTPWTQDTSTILQIGFTYLGMALVLRTRPMIRISAFLAIAPAWARNVLEALSLLAVAAFCVVARITGFEMMLDSIQLGRRQPTLYGVITDESIGKLFGRVLFLGGC